MVLRVKPTPTRFPTNSLYTPMENTPLHSISSECRPWLAYAREGRARSLNELTLGTDWFSRPHGEVSRTSQASPAFNSLKPPKYALICYIPRLHASIYPFFTQEFSHRQSWLVSRPQHQREDPFGTPPPYSGLLTVSWSCKRKVSLAAAVALSSFSRSCNSSGLAWRASTSSIWSISHLGLLRHVVYLCRISLS